MTGDWTSDFAAWKESAQLVRARADRTRAMSVDRARALAREAGTDPEYVFCHAHNALCSFEYGHPWRGVDYSKVRRILWLERKSWEPSRLASRINQRSFNALQRAYAGDRS